MKFQHQLPESFEDVTENFEQIQVFNPLSAKNNLSDLVSAATARKNLGVVVGTGSMTWPGANASSNVVTVTHGLGRAPSVVLITMGPAATSAAIGAAQVVSVTATQFTAYAYDPAGAPPASSVPFSWLAVG